MVGSWHLSTCLVILVYQLDGHGAALVFPWPFNADRLEGFILGYESAAYPEVLEPVIVPYTVSPGYPELGSEGAPVTLQESGLHPHPH